MSDFSQPFAVCFLKSFCEDSKIWYSLVDVRWKIRADTPRQITSECNTGICSIDSFAKRPRGCWSHILMFLQACYTFHQFSSWWDMTSADILCTDVRLSCFSVCVHMCATFWRACSTAELCWGTTIASSCASIGRPKSEGVSSVDGRNLAPVFLGGLPQYFFEVSTVQAGAGFRNHPLYDLLSGND